MNIKKLDTKSITKISVNQVVVDLTMCVKELLENSLDANATKIGMIEMSFNFTYWFIEFVLDVTIYEKGLNGFKVSDNGHGIDTDNFELLSKYKIDAITIIVLNSILNLLDLLFIGKKGATSKIENFEDIEKLSTYGFRVTQYGGDNWT